MARHVMLRRDLRKLGTLGTGLRRKNASCAKTASLRHVRNRRHGAGDNGQSANRVVQAWHRAHQTYRVGVLRVVEDLTNGTVIAGTGTISAKGEVGSIGGIRHKLHGARNDGATVFLAPLGNCGDVVGHIPEGLQVIPMATLDDAITSLEALRDGAPVPSCPGA